MSNPKILLITGDELRHRYFASQLAISIDLCGVIYEKKANKHERTDYGENGNKIIAEHFSQRTLTEKQDFGNQVPLPVHIPVQHVGTTKSNTLEMFEWIKSIQPDMIQLYGSSIIKDHILDAYKNKVLNVHLGLSPYYRGSGTNFWPLVDKCVSCVGATIHLAVLEADAGGVLHQVRPITDQNDNIHHLGNKTIMAALKALPKVINAYYNKQLYPKQQDLAIGKLCLRNDLKPDAIVDMYKSVQEGLISEYFQNKEILDKEYPIIEQI